MLRSSMHSYPLSSFEPNTPRASPPLSSSLEPSTPHDIPWLSSPSPNVTPLTYLTPSPSGSSLPSFPYHHHQHSYDSQFATPKRSRTDSESTTFETAHCTSYQHAEIQTPLTLPQSSSKKSRANNYIASRPITKSLISAMGSLVGPPCVSTSTRSTSNSTISSATACASNFSSNPNLRVHMRRQLSGGQLDPFLGDDHDDMDVEPADRRPRSMSF